MTRDSSLPWIKAGAAFVVALIAFLSFYGGAVQRVTALEVQSRGVEARLQRIEDKLDRIAERLGVPGGHQ